MYHGGEAYQKIGLAGLGSVRGIIGYILGIVFFLTLAILLRRLIQYFLLDWFVASAIGSVPPRLLSQISAFFVYLLAFAAIAGIVFKKDLTVILTASGAVGIIVGLALQSLILDIFAGLAINLDQSVKIGDHLLLHDAGGEEDTIEGTVEEISWRSMRLIDSSHNTVLLPNRTVFASVITNFSRPYPFFEVTIPITLNSKISTERILRILQTAAIEMSDKFSPAEAPIPEASISEISPDSETITYEVSIYPSFETQSTARNLVKQCMVKHLSFSGILPTQIAEPESSHLSELISSCILFNGLADSALQTLVDQAKVQLVESKNSVIRSGEVAMSMFLVVEGLLNAEIKRKIGSKPLPPEILGPGYLIGGAAMLMGDAYKATVITKTPCLLIEIDYTTLEKLFMQFPKTAPIIARNTVKLMDNQNIREQWAQSNDLESEILWNLQRSFPNSKLAYVNPPKSLKVKA